MLTIACMKDSCTMRRCWPLKINKHRQLPRQCIRMLIIHNTWQLWLLWSLNERQLHKEKMPLKSQLLDKASHLTAFCVWDSSPNLPVTPVQLMKPGIGRNASCPVGDCTWHLGQFFLGKYMVRWMFMLIYDSKVTSLLIEAESALGFSSQVRAQTEMRIWCITGMYR